MSTYSATVAPESVTVHLERAPPAAVVAAAESSEHEYWPLTFDAVRDCDLSYFNDSHLADMVRDGMCAIVRVGELPEIKTKEINVWKYLLGIQSSRGPRVYVQCWRQRNRNTGPGPDEDRSFRLFNGMDNAAY